LIVNNNLNLKFAKKKKINSFLALKTNGPGATHGGSSVAWHVRFSLGRKWPRQFPKGPMQRNKGNPNANLAES